MFNHSFVLYFLRKILCFYVFCLCGMWCFGLTSFCIWSTFYLVFFSSFSDVCELIHGMDNNVCFNPLTVHDKNIFILLLFISVAHILIQNLTVYNTYMGKASTKMNGVSRIYLSNRKKGFTFYLLYLCKSIDSNTHQFRAKPDHPTYIFLYLSLSKKKIKYYDSLTAKLYRLREPFFCFNV